MNWIKDNWLLIFLAAIITIAGYSSWELIQYVDEKFGSFFPVNLSRGDWGTLGDLFGGILNPFFALLGLVMLLVTLFQNQRELSLSRLEFKESKEALEAQSITLENQRFEGTFFSLLEQHNLVLEEISKSRISYSFDGEKSVSDSIADSLKEKLIGGGKYKRIFENFNGLEKSRKDLLKSNTKINQYFRILYQVLKFISSNCPNSSIYLNYSVDNLLNTSCSSDEKLYANIVRSFLSEEIYYLLAINCACNDATNSFYKYKLLLERFSLLEHMPLSGKSNMNDELLNEIIRNYDKNAFGENADYKDINNVT